MVLICISNYDITELTTCVRLAFVSTWRKNTALIIAAKINGSANLIICDAMKLAKFNKELRRIWLIWLRKEYWTFCRFNEVAIIKITATFCCYNVSWFKIDVLTWLSFFVIFEKCGRNWDIYQRIVHVKSPHKQCMFNLRFCFANLSLKKKNWKKERID